GSDWVTGGRLFSGTVIMAATGLHQPCAQSSLTAKIVLGRHRKRRRGARSKARAREHPRAVHCFLRPALPVPRGRKSNAWTSGIPAFFRGIERERGVAIVDMGRSNTSLIAWLAGRSAARAGEGRAGGARRAPRRGRGAGVGARRASPRTRRARPPRR